MNENDLKAAAEIEFNEFAERSARRENNSFDDWLAKFEQLSQLSQERRRKKREESREKFELRQQDEQKARELRRAELGGFGGVTVKPVIDLDAAFGES